MQIFIDQLQVLNINGYIFERRTASGVRERGREGGREWERELGYWPQISVDSALADKGPPASGQMVAIVHSPLGAVAAVEAEAEAWAANWTPSVRLLGGMPHLWHG